MCTIIHGIPIIADPALSREEINRIVNLKNNRSEE